MSIYLFQQFISSFFPCFLSFVWSQFSHCLQSASLRIELKERSEIELNQIESNQIERKGNSTRPGQLNLPIPLIYLFTQREHRKYGEREKTGYGWRRRGGCSRVGIQSQPNRIDFALKSNPEERDEIEENKYKDTDKITLMGYGVVRCDAMTASN